jgi:hypothetical protein
MQGTNEEKEKVCCLGSLAYSLAIVTTSDVGATVLDAFCWKRLDMEWRRFSQYRANKTLVLG